MSDKSYQIKENNQVMIQGGEKKVMKKILSVALSTAMAFSMFASVAFGDDALNTQQKFDVLKEKGIFTGYPDGTAGLDKEMTRAEFAKVLVGIMGLEPIEGKASFKDKNYKADKWPAPYVEAVYAAGLMEGKNTTKMIFDFNGKITVQEMAKVLVTAQKLEIPTETNNNASDWAKGYVQAAINAGLVDAKANPKANASRSQLVDVAYSIYLAQQKPAVVSYEVKEDGKVVEFKLANNEVVKVTLETALKANTATEVKFSHNNYDYTEKVTWVVTAATKIQSVAGTNYKQLVVTFDGEVDTKTATNEENYTISNVAVDSASLSADKRVVTLTLTENGNKLPQQKATNLKVNGVKNSDGSRTFNETVSFSVNDTAIPEVKSVTGLGTSAVRVQFSEPVTRLSAGNIANYRIDGKPISGTITYSYLTNSVVISTPLAVGEHTLTAEGVTDFANFKVGNASSTFSVVEDTAAPEVVSAVAKDLQTVVVTFNEPIKSVSKGYHTSTSRPATVSISDNEVTLSFTETNRLGLGETEVFLEAVSDYSNNSSNRSTKVTPVVDTERPTVVGVNAKSTDTTAITVEFSKSVKESDIQNRSNFVLKKADGTVFSGAGFTSAGNPTTSPSYAVKANGTVDNTKAVLKSIGSNLPAGKYTLEISGIRDNTAFGNTMVPQTVEINVTQAGAIQTSAAWYSFDSANDQYNIYVQFDRNVATSGEGNALDVNKYNYVVGSTYYPIPANASITSYTANTVVITVNKDDLNASFTDATVAKKIRVVNVADLNGNYVNTTGSVTDLTEQGVSRVAVGDVNATGTKTIVAKFKGELGYVDARDFVIGSASVATDVYNFTVTNKGYANGETTVEFNLTKDLPANIGDVELRTVAGDLHTVDNYGRKIAAIKKDVADKIKPSILVVNGNQQVGATATTITVKFTENLKLAQTAATFVVRVNGDAVKVDDYTASVNGDQLVITLDNAAPAGALLEVELKGNPDGLYLTDNSGNAADNFNVSARTN
ncbi:S-layer homology domain-containing protein [Paenibacillus lautus]|uniref:S-layer homology domain-containing protein n=1 Tax=Paenibacillus lautus TaxID=1401 RepID=UPI002DB63730|nr:S-layer homology domain-containing protein [Paenibacillus lautus]MEC0259935.1 S-layer homology domain-containing protein [Paenibacillus lautus]